MGGDGAGGLGLAIGIAMLLFVFGAMALFAFIGGRLARNLAPPRRRLVMVLTALAGVGAGMLLVISTFYEATWSPPPRLRLATPAGFDAPVVILLQDRRAARTIAWNDSWLPFTAATGEIAVPPSGIVRVRSFGPMAGRADLEVIWSNGGQGFGAGGGPAPSRTGASDYLIVQPPGAPPMEALQSDDGSALAAYIERREGPR